MKKSTRRFASAVMAAAMALTFSACQNTGSGTPAQTQKAQTEAESTKKFKSLAELEDQEIGIQSGTSMDQTVAEKIKCARFRNYDTYNALVDALKKGRIVAFPGDEPVIRQLMSSDDELTMINEFVDTFEFGYAFRKDEKGQALCDEFSEYIKGLEASGELNDIKAKWTSADESIKIVEDYTQFPATNGTLRMVTEGAYEPFNYFKDGKVIGYDIDIAAKFCREKGYGLEVEMLDFDRIIDAVAEGEYDFAGAGLTITPEREEKVYFSEPNYSGGVVMCVLK
ncbi:MAG: transporter substrate-binding domain-containing protein [Oscillospiraceae bacterium]|nr:transporter substrate-binding domain-containing protein [Oscillospiraceae bacterium]